MRTLILKAAAASVRYANALREICTVTCLDLLGTPLRSSCPCCYELRKSLNENLSAVTRWLTSMRTLGAAISSLFDSSKNKRSD